MKMTICGVRGSIPTTSPDTREHGGNTSCISLESEGWLLVLDAGTGIQDVRLPQSMVHNRVDILLTHLHIDHIQGIGFFKPLFDTSMDIHIWGPTSLTHSLRSRLGRYLSPPFFPVYFRDLPSRLSLHEIGNSSFDIGPFHILSRYIIHPGPTVGFRVQDHSGTIAYLPDHEPALGPYGLHTDLRWVSGSDLAIDADLLFHDAQYTLVEYPEKTGWGHSAMEDAIAFGQLTRVKKLMLTHHDPMRLDQDLRLLYTQLRQTYKDGPEFVFCKEGMRLEL